MRALSLAPAARCSLGLVLFVSCAGRAPAEAPSWEKKVVGGDCELSFAVSVPDPNAPAARIVDRGVGALSRLASARIPSGKRIELCARSGSDEGAEWILVVREIALDAAARLAGSAELLPSGAARARVGRDTTFFVWKRTWALASEGAAKRVQHLDEGDVAAPIALPSGVLGAFAVRGAVARRIERRFVEGSLLARFAEAFAEVRVKADHLTVHARLRFDSEEGARRLVSSMEDGWRRAGDRAARGEDGDLEDLRRDSELRIVQDGASVDATLDVYERGWGTSPGKGRRPVPPTVAAPTDAGAYDAICPSGRRFDLDTQACVP